MACVVTKSISEAALENRTEETIQMISSVVIVWFLKIHRLHFLFLTVFIFNTSAPSNKDWETLFGWFLMSQNGGYLPWFWIGERKWVWGSIERWLQFSISLLLLPALPIEEVTCYPLESWWFLWLTLTWFRGWTGSLSKQLQGSSTTQVLNSPHLSKTWRIWETYGKSTGNRR